MNIPADQIAIILRLAIAIRDSRQSQRKEITLDATAVAAFLESAPKEKPADKEARLAVGETCLFCGSTGKAKPPKKEGPKCHICQQPFTRKTPWMLFRGQRRHVACFLKK